MTMHIQCQKCGHHQKVDKKLFANILGAVTAGFGYFAWVSFLFAGTGLAMPICIAIMVGGAGMLKYSNEIASWMSQYYPCPKCGAKNWKTVSEEELELNKVKEQAVTIERYDEVSVFPVMRKLYSDAEDYIYMSFPWYTMESVQEDFPLLRDAVRRGVEIYIYYGIKPRDWVASDKKSARRTIEAINWLKENLGETNVYYQPVDSHLKAILCEKYTLEGSHNLMSYRPKHKDRGEITTKHTGLSAIKSLRSQIKAQAKLAQFDDFAYGKSQMSY